MNRRWLRWPQSCDMGVLPQAEFTNQCAPSLRTQTASVRERASAQGHTGVQGEAGRRGSPVLLGSRWTTSGRQSKPGLRMPQHFRCIVEASFREFITARSLKFNIESAFQRLMSHGRCTWLAAVRKSLFNFLVDVSGQSKPFLSHHQ